jgi:hypothetical protein
VGRQEGRQPLRGEPQRRVGNAQASLNNGGSGEGPEWTGILEGGGRVLKTQNL